MAQSKNVKPDPNYGEAGYAAFPFLPDDDTNYLGGIAVSAQGEAVAALLNLRDNRQSVFVRLDADGAWDQSFGTNGYKPVDHTGIGLPRDREFTHLLKVAADQGAGYVAISNPEIPVAKDGQRGQAIHIALARFDESLNLVKTFGKGGIAMPAYAPALYGSWQEAEAATAGPAPGERAASEARATARDVAIADGKLRLVHSPHVRTNGFTFYAPFIVEVDLVSGACSLQPLKATGIGFPSGAYREFDALFLEDGRTVVAGALGARGEGGGIVVLYQRDGTPDQSFGRPDEKYGYIGYQRGSARAWLDAKDRLLVLGDEALRRLKLSGEPDPDYGSNGEFPFGDFIHTGLFDGDEALIVSFYGNSSMFYQRRTARGSDTDFAEFGTYIDPRHIQVGRQAFKVDVGMSYHVQVIGTNGTGLLRLQWSADA